MSTQKIPFFGARSYARSLQETLVQREAEIEKLKTERAEKDAEANRLGLKDIFDLESKRKDLEISIKSLESAKIDAEKKYSETVESANKALRDLEIHIKNTEIDAKNKIAEIQQGIVETEELALLQEAGVYHYRHPLTDAFAYQTELKKVEDSIKLLVKQGGRAVLAATGWTVNGSEAQGRKMVSDTSKLMLRAFNAEADNLIRTLKPYKLDAAVARLKKVSETIERLGRTMSIRISSEYFNIRVYELELTADFLRKEDEEKQAEREERARLREERKAQLEMERERARLEKERQHYANALEALERKGDSDAAEKMREHLDEVQRAIEDVDYRAANIRAGYVYVISNIGSFGQDMVKIGMTRRLDPMDRVRELSDASVPFNFDVHALFFSKDAITIETTMHHRLAHTRVNQINLRREFFRVTPEEAKRHLAELAGDILQFQDVPEAIEYRESLQKMKQYASEGSAVETQP